jgi:hypothetical protein
MGAAGDALETVRMQQVQENMTHRWRGFIVGCVHKVAQFPRIGEDFPPASPSAPPSDAGRSRR